jgi:hypothetical protein
MSISLVIKSVYKFDVTEMDKTHVYRLERMIYNRTKKLLTKSRYLIWKNWHYWTDASINVFRMEIWNTIEFYTEKVGLSLLNILVKCLSRSTKWIHISQYSFSIVKGTHTNTKTELSLIEIVFNDYSLNWRWI